MPISCSSCGAMVQLRSKFCPECGAAHAAPSTPASPRDTAPTSAAKKLRRTLVLSTLVGVPFWLVMYFAVFNTDGCSKAQGTLTAKGLAQASDLTFSPKLCKSGQHMSFHGVALFAQKNSPPIVTVVTSHLEATYVLVDPPPCGTSCRVKLTRAECSRFQVTVERTNTTVNEIRLLDGQLALTCALKGGAEVHADLKFENCD